MDTYTLSGPYHTALVFYAITHLLCFFPGDDGENAVVALVVDVVDCKEAAANLNDESDLNMCVFVSKAFVDLVEDVEVGFV